MLYINEIKQAVTMRKVCDAYGINVDRHGNAVCPFHADHSPSMKIYPRSGGYYCFACGAGGDVIDFVRGFFGLSLADACRKLNDDFALGLPIDKQLSLREMREAERALKERAKKRAEEKALYERIVSRYWSALDALAALDRSIPDKPTSWDDISDEAARAMILRPCVIDALSEAEMELYNYEHSQR